MVDVERQGAEGGQSEPEDLERLPLGGIGVSGEVKNTDALRSNIEQLPYNSEKANDDARRWIAMSLIFLLAGLVAMTFVALIWALAAGEADTKTNYEHIAGILNILFGPVVTLVGSATGFYFGAQSRQAKPVAAPNTITS